MANINSKIINLAIFWPRWYLEEVKDIPREAHFWTQGVTASDVLFPQVMDETVEVARLIRQEGIQRRIAEEIVNVPVPKTQEQIVAAVKENTMEEILVIPEVAFLSALRRRLSSCHFRKLWTWSLRLRGSSIQERMQQRTVQSVELIKVIPQERVSIRIVERTVDLPIPQTRKPVSV